ncbi:hypothetical protein BD410DRAFT_82767 [Rickenella mellea]|uniref:F-box domain-containing protein n=1 Tax=Rickenella mellea TaxID=50990 RepID=A0A4Y7PK95_9AGAM|nr:hypothetical protein BD410DRAFT_82767 [Rickenella mellea]
MIVNLDHQLTMYSSFMDSVMMKIFFFCKNLVALGWKSTGAIGISDLSSLMASIPVTITTLEWYRHTSARSFKSLQNHTALRNLAVSHLVFRSREDRNVTIPFITHLDVREPLKICVNLPSLSHLTLDWAERDHLEQLLGKSKDTIRSIYFRAPRRSSSDEFPATLARMPKLQIFAYDVTINAYENPRFPSSWLGVGRHASLTNIHLFCRAGFRGGNRENGSFSTLRDAISGHLQPLMTAYQMPLSISIMNARLIFEIADFHEDGYDAAANQRFFDDLSASLSSATVQCIVK